MCSRAIKTIQTSGSTRTFSMKPSGSEEREKMMSYHYPTMSYVAPFTMFITDLRLLFLIWPLGVRRGGFARSVGNVNCGGGWIVGEFHSVGLVRSDLVRAPQVWCVLVGSETAPAESRRSRVVCGRYSRRSCRAERCGTPPRSGAAGCGTP